MPYKILAIVALVSGIVAISWVGYQGHEWFELPYEAQVMDDDGDLTGGLAIAFCLVSGIPICVYLAIANRKNLPQLALALWLLALNLVPWPLAYILFSMAVKARGLLVYG